MPCGPKHKMAVFLKLELPLKWISMLFGIKQSLVQHTAYFVFEIISRQIIYTCGNFGVYVLIFRLCNNLMDMGISFIFFFRV
jgi:hypothetical protein